jgi:AraC-like DNA-binding protein
VSVSIFLVRTVVEAVERYGANLRGQIALDWRQLGHPESRIEFEQFAQVLSAAVTITGNDALGLQMADEVREGAVDLLAHLAAHAPTMREAVETASQFARLAMDELLIAARYDGDCFVVDYTFPRTTLLSDRALAEFMMGGLVQLARSFNGPTVYPRVARFEHERPNHHLEYTPLFGDNQRFGQGTTSIAFERHIADRLQLHQNPELYQLLRSEAQRKLNRIETGLRPVTRLRQYLRAMPPSSIPEISAVARELGMSERSLRRRLAADGTSYREAVRTVLEASAGRLLQSPSRTIKETATALGFADAAAFHRAFKRWTGMTPGEYRRSMVQTYDGDKIS